MSKQWKYGLAALAIVAFAGCQKPGATAVTGEAPVPAPATVSPSPGLAASPSLSGTPALTASATPGMSATPGQSATPAVEGPPGKPLENALTPLPEKTGQFPVLTKKTTIKMDTSAGEVLLEIYPEAAPNACKRFVELVESGFYNDTPFSRVVKQPAPFVAQFGINWRSPHNAWEKKTFKDDPSYFALERGTLAFAKGGIDTNSTQVFINYRENNSLAEESYNFTTFGKVVKGMDVVDNLPAVGDPSGGLDQFRLWTDGGNYLETLSTKPAMIEKMTVVKS